MREFYRLRTESRKPFVARILSNFLRPQVVQSDRQFVHRNRPVLHTDSTETGPFLCTTESLSAGLHQTEYQSEYQSECQTECQTDSAPGCSPCRSAG